MPVSLDIRADLKQVKKNLTFIQRSVIPKATYRALNETATAHRTVGVKAVAKELKLPQRLLLNRLDSQGNIKAKRTRVSKANKNRLTAAIVVYIRGIPVIQAMSRAQKVKSAINARSKKGVLPYVKAAGGRTYKRAFLATAKGGHAQVFQRRTKKRYKLFVPKIGVHDDILEAYDKALGQTGSTVFRKRFKRLIDYEVSKLGRTR